jgi:hypothetical protein
MQKLQDYPLTAIIDKKHSKCTNKLGTIKKFTSYKCKWMQPENHNYTMWMSTDKVQIHLNECNPDTDINTVEPTIQIIHNKALIFTYKGNHLITISKNRLEWLKNQYNTNSNEQHQLDPPCQPFETEVISLYERYKYRIPKIDPP